MIKRIRKSLAYWQMRSIEINLQGTLDAMQFVRDPDTLEGMRQSVKMMRKALAKARAEYQSFLPPGRRMTFKVA